MRKLVTTTCLFRCGYIFCSSCSSGKTLLDPNIAMPIQFVAATTSNKNINYNRNSGGFDFDGFEYNYLDYEELDQEQQEQHQERELCREHQQQKQKYGFEYKLDQSYDQKCLFEHDYEIEPEFDENYVDDYFSDEDSIMNYSYDNSDSSSSLVDFNNFTTCDLIYDDDSFNNDDEEDKKDKIDYGSEPVRERICINCHAVFELDENDWCCD